MDLAGYVFIVNFDMRIMFINKVFMSLRVVGAELDYSFPNANNPSLLRLVFAAIGMLLIS